MKNKIVPTKKDSNLIALSRKEQAQVKGGLLIYCEEKRRKNIFGQTYTTTEWKMKRNGSLWITVQP